MARTPYFDKMMRSADPKSGDKIRPDPRWKKYFPTLIFRLAPKKRLSTSTRRALRHA
jgi:hypothetical protein